MSNKIDKLLRHSGGNYILPFFWQHGETEEVLRDYMRVIHDCGIGEVCIESRPHPDFCGPRWWKDMDVILDEAGSLGMKVWILDDSHFPTGYANGAMEQQPAAFHRQSICCRIRDLKGPEEMRITSEELAHPDPFEKTQIENFLLNDDKVKFEDDELAGIYAAPVKKDGLIEIEKRIDLKPYIDEKGLIWQVPEGRWRLYTIHLSRNFGYHRSYINMMDRRSCRVLIDAVYEPHYAHYKDEFGRTIAGFFSDEPELGNGHMFDYRDGFGKMTDYPWSAELQACLGETLGPDLFGLLTLLWEENADRTITARVRYAFMDGVTKLVREDFSRQIGDWCRERNVRYIGHLIEDNNHHSRTGSSLGHYFRGLEGQDMAGIDDIGGQVFPQGEEVSYDDGAFMLRDGRFYHYLLGKLASSAAAVEPWKHGNSMCEIFGAYGWEEGVKLEKYLADHFMVRGINHFVPHAFSAKEFPDPDCPPHFYAQGNNPQYRHFGALMKYMNRICELLSGGRHVATAAVLYHGEGDWTGRCITDERVGQVLCDRQIEYDIVPSDVFLRPEVYLTDISDRGLQVNRQLYRVLIIPGTEYIVKETAEAALRLFHLGVKVYFTDFRPVGIVNTPMADPEDEIIIRELHNIPLLPTETLAQVLSSEGLFDVRIEPEDDRIRYCHYVHEDSDVFYMVNEGVSRYTGTIRLPEEIVSADTVLYEYDAWENRLLNAASSRNSAEISLEPGKSLILIADRSGDGVELSEKKTASGYTEEIVWEHEWKRSICTSKQYPSFENEKMIVLPDHLEEEEPLFSGFVCYENRFEAGSGDDLLLVIQDASEGVEVFINGESLGIQIVPEYIYDLQGHLLDGENDIRIEVATTLERQMSTIPDMMGRYKEPVSRSGITGEVRLLGKTAVL